MKTNLIEKSRKPASEIIALFSRLTGVGVTGFSNHPVLQEEEISIQEKDNIAIEENNDKTASFCQDQQTSQNAHATIDLWF